MGLLSVIGHLAQGNPGGTLIKNKNESLQPEKVMIIFAHPDDAEGNCGGTTAKGIKEGKIIHYLVLTNGDKGSDDLSMTSEKLGGIREKEQEAAAKVLGVSGLTFLRVPDGELEVSVPFRREITLLIRLHQPAVIFTHDPWKPYQLHPDHRAAGFLALDAITAARDHLFYPDQLPQGLKPCRVREVYLFGTESPDFWVDISESIEIKLQAVRCHESQGLTAKAVQERIRNRALEVGKIKGYRYGEAFKKIVM
jgi:LmbE family N-acetylglucosaminyl deacetylase